MMIRAHHIKILSILVLMHWASFSVAAIDDGSRAAARELVNAGAKEFKAGHFDAALVKFNDALAIAEVPTVAVWAAQANEKLGKLLAAHRLYTSALLMPKNELWIGNAQSDAQNKARQALQELEPRIPRLTIAFEGVTSSAGIEVTIDRERIKSEALRAEFPIDPGEHEILAAQGSRSAKATVVCMEGKKSVVRLTLNENSPGTATVAAGTRQGPLTGPGQSAQATRSEPGRSERTLDHQPSSTGKGQRTAGWIVTGAGAAGVVIGIATGIAAGVKRSSLHSDGCVDNNCFGSGYGDRVDSYNTLRTVSGVGLVAGGVVAAAGVTLLLTAPKRESAASIGLSINPGQLGLVGAY